MRLRAIAAASAVVAAVVTISAVPAHAATPTHTNRLGAPAAVQVAPAVTKTSASSLAHPSSNTAPSQAFWSACYQITTSKADNDSCDAAALVDFNSVRADEGLPAMKLPSGFDTLSVPLQLLAISDVERVDRGLAPIAGLSSQLNALAQSGAKADEDPPWPSPFPGTAGTSNWAGAGNSVLLDDFLWMYDDGYPSPNMDCDSPTASGCWGHRDNILYPFSDPIRMGAAVAYNTSYGTSMAQEIIGGGSGDPVDVAPNWAGISGTSTFAQDTEALTPRQVPPRLSAVASRHRVRRHHHARIRGLIANYQRVGLAHRKVTLQRRRPGGGHWHTLITRRSRAHGVVHFVLRPRWAASYRLVALARNGKLESSSRAVKIRVRR